MDEFGQSWPELGQRLAEGSQLELRLLRIKINYDPALILKRNLPPVYI